MVCNVLLKHDREPGDCMTPRMTPVSKQVCRKSWGCSISTGKINRNMMCLGWLSRKTSLPGLLEFFEGVQSHKEKVDLADKVHLDFQKVSNMLPSQKLLKKLISHTIAWKLRALTFFDMQLVKKRIGNIWSLPVVNRHRHYQWSSAGFGARTIFIKDAKKGWEITWQSYVCCEVIEVRDDWRNWRT